MKASTRNKIAGNAKIVKGDAEQIAGKVLGKKLLQAKGRAETLLGKLQKQAGKRQKSEGK